MVLISDDRSLSLWTRLVEWFQGPLGHSVLQAERAQLGPVLSGLFGFHIVQIGALGAADLFAGSRIAHRIVLNIDPQLPIAMLGHPLCAAGALPLQTRSIDVIVLPHVLEFQADGMEVLRETERVLAGEGHVVILGFNPWSLWGLWRLCSAWGKRVPWCGRFLAMGRLQARLRDLGFDIVQSRRFNVRAPWANAPAERRWEISERIGAWLGFGGVYLLVGKKRIEAMTPIGARRHAQRRVLHGGVAGSSVQRVEP